MDAHALKRKFQEIEWPVSVPSWRVEKGQDSEGQDAVWVWIAMDDALLHSDERAKLRRFVRELIWETEDNIWVYVRFRDVEEVEAP